MVSECRISTVSRCNTCSRCYAVGFIRYGEYLDEHCNDDESGKTMLKFAPTIEYSCGLSCNCKCNISC